MTQEFKKLNMMLTGVGGQGTILASNVLAELGIQLDLDVKKAEIHGMSQRGGSVVSQVLWAERVFSPIIDEGAADILVCFEKSEVARTLSYLKKDGIVLVNDYSIVPITVSSGGFSYPEDEALKAEIAKVTKNSFWIKGIDIAEKIGSPKIANVVLLGAMSKVLDMPKENWIEVIKKRVPPKFVEMNLTAFEKGRDAINQD